MTEPRELLEEYVRNGSEAAFNELVTRYINLVYSSAVRLTGGVVETIDPNAAQKSQGFYRLVLLP